MFGKINKNDLFFGDRVYYNDEFKGSINDVVVFADGRCFVIDQEHTLLIKVDNYYLSITSIQSYLEFLKVKKDIKLENGVYKCLCVDTNVMNRLLLSGKDLSGLNLICKDNITSYDDTIAEYYGIRLKNRDYLTFGECKKLSNRCTKEHDGMDDVVKSYMKKMR